MLKNSNLRVKTGFSDDDLLLAAAARLRILPDALCGVRLVRLSLDARDKEDIFYNAAVRAEVKNEERFLKLKDVEKYTPYSYPQPPVSRLVRRPVVAGSGPAGLFAALILASAGAEPILIERGEQVENRIKTVQTFQKSGILNPDSNVQFGEGGAGTFSDGKLTTGTKDHRRRKVLDEFILAGAPEEIGYLAKPHIGTDRLIDVVKNLRKKIIALGGEVRFNCKLKDLYIENGSLVGVSTSLGDIETDKLILATGHSARDIFELCRRHSLLMERKPFSVGVRIEHPQSLIQRAQYGRTRGLPPADYKAAVHLKDGRGVYTFCMCPGGEVIASASEENTVVTNGMSNFRRDGKNANSALLVSVNPDDFQNDDLFAGVRFQQKLEKQAFYMAGGGYKAPMSLVGDFLKGQKSVSIGSIEPTYPLGVAPSDLGRLFPAFVTEALREGIPLIDRRIHSFATADAPMTGVESRSSSPLRICRGEDLQSSVRGIYPCGEGAGYAGGIMSAAVDGIRCAEEVLR